MKHEVLAPAGSLDHALWALEGGADAVYFGLRKFSARSHAENLSLDDVSSLTSVAKTKSARSFCAINTILKTEELNEAVALVWELYFRGVDAIIVQDLGFALALKRFGPPIDLHASTQTAVHNSGGVVALRTMGFRRVVLARELTMAEIGVLVRRHPEMEFEVFVHGALCYAVSGNCMASGMMIGRSANRGDCGQICRTKFELDYLIPGPKRKDSPHEEGLPEGIHAPPGETTWKSGTIGAFASMNDLELGARVRELASLGVHSFKIEGRMKPPAYSFNTARAYRAFLDGGRDQEAWGWLDEARVRYGRLPSAGWFDGHKALSQINPTWAGTLGMPLGEVVRAEDRSIFVSNGGRSVSGKPLAKGDGIMILGCQMGQTFRGALATGSASDGAHVELTVADSIGFNPTGGTVWLISRHDGKLPVKKGGKPWRHPISTTIVLEESSNSGEARVTISSEALGGFVWESTIAFETAHGDRSIEDSLTQVFRASDSAFVPGTWTVENRIGRAFVPPKALKELRRSWYAVVEEKARSFVSNVEKDVSTAANASRVQSASDLPPRSSLSPRTGVNALTGFVVEWETLKSNQLAETKWGLSLPLAPFTPNEESYFGRLKDFLVRIREEGFDGKIFLGLSNPCHLTWVLRLRGEGFDLPAWFADWGFHAANPWTSIQLESALPGLAFALPWLEDADTTDRSYFPPLFTSRACMLRNSFGAQGQPSAVPTPGNQAFDSREWIQAKLKGTQAVRPTNGPRCPDGCAGHFSARLVQGKSSFRVEARDCINYLITEDEG